MPVNLWRESSLKDALLLLTWERMIPRVLEARFGSVSEEIVTALGYADGETLETLW